MAVKRCPEASDHPLERVVLLLVREPRHAEHVCVKREAVDETLDAGLPTDRGECMGDHCVDRVSELCPRDVHQQRLHACGVQSAHQLRYTRVANWRQ